MSREIPKPQQMDWFETKVSNDGWLMPAKDRGFVGDQHTLFDLDDHVLPECKSRRSAVQAGAGIGMWPARLSGFFENVYTFEPNPELFYCVVRNAPQKNIHKFQAALGDAQGCVDMSWGFSRNNYGGYYVTDTGPIPSMSIDDLGLEDVDLIMVDIEGREWAALRGALKTIRRCNPVIVFESKEATVRKFGYQLADLRHWLKQTAGYRLKTSFHQNKDELWVPRSSQ